MNDQKSLLIFDFDNTIVNGFSDFPVIDLLKDNVKRQTIIGKYGRLSWLEVMQEIFLELHKQNTSISEIKQAVESTALTEGFLELFQFIEEKSHMLDNIIVSGGNALFIDWLINKHNLSRYKCYALPAEIYNDSIIRVDKHHNHSCSLCPIDQCKTKVIEDHLSIANLRYKDYYFFGDGNNDLCPASWLKETDHVFPRIDYEMELKIRKNPGIVKCRVKPWKTGLDILKVLKKLL